MDRNRITLEPQNLNIPPNDDKLALVDNFAVFLQIAFTQMFVSSAVERSIRSMTLIGSTDKYRKAEQPFKKACLLLLSGHLHLHIQTNTKPFSTYYVAFAMLIMKMASTTEDTRISNTKGLVIHSLMKENNLLDVGCSLPQRIFMMMETAKSKKYLPRKYRFLTLFVGYEWRYLSYGMQAINP